MAANDAITELPPAGFAIVPVEDKPAIACYLGAIPRAKRRRYEKLKKKVQAALLDRVELEDGYSFVLDSRWILAEEIADWIALEHCCCPFLSFNLEIGVNNGMRLVLRGPAGVKEVIHEAFPVA